MAASARTQSNPMSNSQIGQLNDRLSTRLRALCLSAEGAQTVFEKPGCPAIEEMAAVFRRHVEGVGIGHVFEKVKSKTVEPSPPVHYDYEHEREDRYRIELEDGTNIRLYGRTNARVATKRYDDIHVGDRILVDIDQNWVTVFRGRGTVVASFGLADHHIVRLL